MILHYRIPRSTPTPILAYSGTNSRLWTVPGQFESRDHSESVKSDEKRGRILTESGPVR